MLSLTAASRDIISDTNAATAPRKNAGAMAFEKICASLSMSGTRSMLQLLHHPRSADFQRLPTRLTGPPRFIGVPRRTPTPTAPTPGVTTARATGLGRSTTPGVTTQPAG